MYTGTVAFMGKWGYQVAVQEGHTSVVTASGTAAAPQVPAGSGVTTQQGGGTVTQGYNNTAGTTGGTGVVSTPPSGGNNPKSTDNGGVDIAVSY